VIEVFRPRASPKERGAFPISLQERTALFDIIIPNREAQVEMPAKAVGPKRNDFGTLPIATFDAEVAEGPEEPNSEDE
jgi:hypothetical protein